MTAGNDHGWETLTVSDIGAHGDGLAYFEDQPVYLPGALPGDKVRVQLGRPGKYGIAVSAVDLLDKGPHHAEPACQHYDRCGGCNLQHLDDQAYRTWLDNRLLDPLKRVGIEATNLLDPVITKPGSRRRVSLKLQKRGKRIVLGYLEKGSHTVVPINECLVAHPTLTSLFAPLRDGLSPFLPQRSQMEITLTLVSNGVDVLVKGGPDPDLALREWGAAFAEEHDIAAFHWHDGVGLDPILIRREPVMRFGKAVIGFPPASFIQASEDGEAALVDFVCNGVAPKDRIIDLFAGLGTFSVPLAEKKAHVLAVEGAREPLRLLKQGAGRQQLDIRCNHRDLYRRPLTDEELKTIDRVVLDPPRAGAEAQAKYLAKSTVPVIVSISCNPATFARDAKLLTDGGYQLTDLKAVDQFLWSSHLEIAGRFIKH